MIFESMKALEAAYLCPREEMDFETEAQYVQDCFDTYEASGFMPVYCSPYEQYQHYNGFKFHVDRRISPLNDDVDLECLPQWKITFEDGTQIDAYPEEICIEERKTF